jgi:hypothetical protein
MTSLYVEIEINAAKNRVWDVLIAKDKWMYWNTFLFDTDPSRPFLPGRKVFLSLQRIPEEEETQFQATVKLLQPEACLKLISSIPGLQTEYLFELQEIGLRRTKYVHQIAFSGILKGLFLPFIREDEQKGMKRMARELKRYLES